MALKATGLQLQRRESPGGDSGGRQRGRPAALPSAEAAQVPGSNLGWCLRHNVAGASSLAMSPDAGQVCPCSWGH